MAVAAILDYLYSSCRGKQNIDPTTNNNLIIDLIGSRGRDTGEKERKECPTFEHLECWHACLANYISIRIAD
jgi:hypothetical protein